jgi:hypothetical protein
MYNRGGYVYQKSDSSGYVFLEEDWNGERLPNDLIEEAGLAFHKLSLLDSRNRALQKRVTIYVLNFQNAQIQQIPNKI